MNRAYLVIAIRDMELVGADIAGADHRNLTRKFDGTLMATVAEADGANFGEAKSRLLKHLEDNLGKGQGYEQIMKVLKVR